MVSPIIKIQQITKRFGTVVANHAVDLEVFPGEIHALVGENGAGKTTLMNILYGLIHADAGEIFIDGNLTKIDSPSNAIQNGIGMVHQHFMLIPPFTVTDNVILGNEPKRFRFLINKLFAQHQVESVSATYGLKIDPSSKVENIGVGLEQRVELIKHYIAVHGFLFWMNQPRYLLRRKQMNYFSSCVNLNNRGKPSSLLPISCMK